MIEELIGEGSMRRGRPYVTFNEAMRNDVSFCGVTKSVVLNKG